MFIMLGTVVILSLSKLSFIVHNLCCERLIFKKISVFSSCLVELQYGVARSVFYSGPNCPFSGEREKRGRFYSL